MIIILFLKYLVRNKKLACHRRNLTYVDATTLQSVITLTYKHFAFELYGQKADSKEINRHINSKHFVSIFKKLKV